MRSHEKQKQKSNGENDDESFTHQIIKQIFVELLLCPDTPLCAEDMSEKSVK